MADFENGMEIAIDSMGMNTNSSARIERSAVQLKLIEQQEKCAMSIEQIARSQFEHCGQNVIQYASIIDTQKDRLHMDRNVNLILTGWGHAEYVVSAAVPPKRLTSAATL